MLKIYRKYKNTTYIIVKSIKSFNQSLIQCT